MFTAAAGLISAVTGLVVAVQQLHPTHRGGAATAADTRPVSPSANAPASGDGSAPPRAAALRVSFPAGRTVTANGGMRYDLLSGRTTVSNPGQLALALRVRVTNPGRYDANFWNATFRLRAGAETGAPTSLLDDLVHGGTTDVADVVFAVPASTRRATLLVGDDPAKAIALPLRLAFAK
jgi:hypothetical protein